MALPATTIVLYKLDDGTGVTIDDATGDAGNDLTPSTVPGNGALDFSMFRQRATGQQTCDCVLDAVHIFSPLLTSGQRDAVHNSGNGLEYASFDAGTQAKTLASYGLGEASGAASFADSSANGRTLTVQGGSLVQVAAKVGNGQDNVNSTSYAWRAATGMGGGLADLEVDFWVSLNSLNPATGAVQFFMGFGALANNQFGWCVYYNRHGADASGRFQVDYGNGAESNIINNSVVRANTFGAPAAGTLYHVNARYDVTLNKLLIRVNNGADNEVYPVAQPVKTTALISTGNAAYFVSGATAFTGLSTGGDEAQGNYDAAGCHYAFKDSPGDDLKFVNGTSKWWWAWVKLLTTSGTQQLFGIRDRNGGSNKIGYCVQFSGGSWYWIMSTGIAGGTLDFPSPVAGNDTNTHLLMGGYRSSDNKLWISIDNGTESTLTKTVTVAMPASVPFVLAATKDGSGFSEQLQAIVDAIGFADGEPTTPEKDAVWNSGNGTETLAASGNRRRRALICGAAA